MFLINSRLGRFSAARFGSPRIVVHLPRAPLLPKLRGQFAEFLLRGSLEHLRLLASPTCVGLRYGQHERTPPRGFSWRLDYGPLAGPEGPFGIGARLTRGICLPSIAYHLTSDIPPPDGPVTPASPLGVKRSLLGTGIFTCFPSTTPFGLVLGTD